MNKKTTEIMVGLFVVLGALALLFLALKAANLASFTGGGNSYTVQARFENIGGLKARAPVKSAGVLIGRVQAIRFDSDSYRALVQMEIDKRFEFPADSSASILTSGLLGEQYIGLDAGADIEPLKDGDRVLLTQSAVVLEKLIGQFLFDKAAAPAAQ